MRVAINGFGRIGRIFLRVAFERKKNKFQIVAINDVHGVEASSYLLKHDSVYSKFPGKIKVKGNSIFINGKETKVFSERDPKKLPWKKLRVDVVVESTGVFTDRTDALQHLKAGAKKVIITAPSKTCNTTIVPGVNIEKSKNINKEKVISMGSCTTNALAIAVNVLNENFGIKRSFYNTIHAYTNDQNLQDSFHRKMRRGRAAAQNIVPTTSGASISVVAAIPALKGRVAGLATRIPVVVGSIVDLTAELEKKFTVNKVNLAFKKASKKLKGILEYSEEDLVSSDITGNPNSAIFDSKSTMQNGNLVKILVWYDNEYGYSNRIVDLLNYIK